MQQGYPLLIPPSDGGHQLLISATTAPTVSVDTTGRAGTFTVTQSEFDGYEGQWYLVASDLNQRAKPGAGAVFNVKSPKLDVTIRDPNQNDGADVSGKSVPTGSQLQFQIGTNMYTVLDPVLRNPVYGMQGAGVNTERLPRYCGKNRFRSYSHGAV